jgi:hypothetical protein
MKINERILSIPPYISTSWDNVASIRINEENALEITLHVGTKVVVFNLSTDLLETIFHYHVKSMELADENLTQDPFTLNMGKGGIVLSGMENFTGMMQHDPSQSDGPSLPFGILSKIAEMGKAIGVDAETFNIPEGEPNCNCPYCQIAKAIHGIKSIDSNLGSADFEEVTKEELTFREWDIVQKNDKLYDVLNPLDKTEKYSVYLGDPIGCTCGKNNCEHILAVLKS